jgi:hypothetical protein
MGILPPFKRRPGQLIPQAPELSSIDGFRLLVVLGLFCRRQIRGPLQVPWSLHCDLSIVASRCRFGRRGGRLRGDNRLIGVRGRLRLDRPETDHHCPVGWSKLAACASPRGTIALGHKRYFLFEAGAFTIAATRLVVARAATLGFSCFGFLDSRFPRRSPFDMPFWSSFGDRGTRPRVVPAEAGHLAGAVAHRNAHAWLQAQMSCKERRAGARVSAAG